MVMFTVAKRKKKTVVGGGVVWVEVCEKKHNRGPAKRWGGTKSSSIGTKQRWPNAGDKREDTIDTGRGDTQNSLKKKHSP